MTDWREPLLRGLEPVPGVPGADSVRVGLLDVGAHRAVVAAWDFTVKGGSFGVAEAAALVAAVDAAVRDRLPLVTFLRSGGTRLQEGMAALVGIPRAALALDRLAAAGLPHVSVVDAPTTGGVWVAVGSTADVRLGVAGATVGFSGARAIEAMTGVALGPGANTAESALAAGLLDEVVHGHEVAGAVANLLSALAPDTTAAPEAIQDMPPPVPVPQRRGWEQVEHSRTVGRLDGGTLLQLLLAPGGAWAPLRGPDATANAGVGRLGVHRVVMVAAAARRAGRVGPGGYSLLRRAALLADRLDAPLVTLVDTAGADPLPDSERAGLAPALAEAMRAVLASRAPTVSVVHGEGGSGGALAAAVTDVVAVTPDGWFAALGPEGAAATLRIAPGAAADLMRVAPADLLADGFADAMVPSDPDALRAWLVAAIDGLRRAAPGVRRRERWAQALPGSPRSAPDGPAGSSER